MKIILNKYQFHLRFLLILSVISKVLKAMKVLTHKKNQDYVPCSFAYKFICIDDKFTKPIVFYRAESAAYEFTKESV